MPLGCRSLQYNRRAECGAQSSLHGKRAALPSRPDKWPEMAFLTQAEILFFILCVSANDSLVWKVIFGLDTKAALFLLS